MRYLYYLLFYDRIASCLESRELSSQATHTTSLSEVFGAWMSSFQTRTGAPT